MYSRRLVQILMVALSILIATRASWLHHHDVEARQLSVSVDGSDGGGDTPTAAADETTPAPTPTEEPASSTSPTQNEETSTTPEPDPTTSSDPPTTSDDPTTTPTSETPSSTPPPPTTSSDGPTTPTPTPDPTSSTPPPSSTTEGSNGGNGDNNNTSSSGNNNGGGGGGNNDGTTSKNTTPKTTPPPVTVTVPITYTTTDDRGSTFVGTSKSIVVSTPGFSGDGSKGHGGEMPAQTRDTIIGVTVGVGGAIVLAVGGLLFWRLRNKRRNQEENEELISYGAGFGGPGTAEKTEGSAPSASARSPFQSTLETYHAPTQTNAASNF